MTMKFCVEQLTIIHASVAMMQHCLSFLVMNLLIHPTVKEFSKLIGIWWRCGSHCSLFCANVL